MMRYSPGHLACALRTLRVGPLPRHERMSHWLVYMTDGWSLAINGHSMVDERPKAGPQGPDYPSLDDDLAVLSKTLSAGTCADLDWFVRDASDTSILEAVWRRYGDMAPAELMRAMLRPGTPWWQAQDAAGRIISAQSMKAYFTIVALNGRTAQTKKRINEDQTIRMSPHETRHGSAL